MSRSKQLSLADIYAGCLDIFDNDKPGFLSLLAENIDIDALIPLSFRQRFYAWTGRHREYPLTGFLWSLIIRRIFSIPTDSLLIIFLRYSKDLREFCGFSSGRLQVHTLQAKLPSGLQGYVRPARRSHRTHLGKN